MHKKRIYFLINSLEGGGAERVIINLSSNMIDDFDVILIALKSGGFYNLPKGVRYISLSKIHNNFFMILLVPYYVRKFKSVLKKEQLFLGVSFLEIANFVHLLTKKNAIISFRTTVSFFTGIGGFIYKFLIKLLYVRAQTIIVNSEENRRDLASFLGVALGKIKTIYNPLCMAEIKQLQKEKIDCSLSHKIHGKRVFITVGRLIRKKHHEKILLAIKKIYNEVDKNLAYLIIGDGPQKSYLHSLSNDLGLSDVVVFLGEQTNVFKYLYAADYFLYASEVEGFPNVLLEAIACGLFIITSNFKTGAREVICGEYKEHRTIKYPYFGDNGILIDLKEYGEQFSDIYARLNGLKSKKKGIERFDVDNVIADRKNIFNN